MQEKQGEERLKINDHKFYEIKKENDKNVLTVCVVFFILSYYQISSTGIL